MKKLAAVSLAAFAGFVFAVALLGVALVRIQPARAGTAAAARGSGDANGDGRVDISDPVRMLGVLFSGQTPPAGGDNSSVGCR